MDTTELADALVAADALELDSALEAADALELDGALVAADALELVGIPAVPNVFFSFITDFDTSSKSQKKQVFCCLLPDSLPADDLLPDNNDQHPVCRRMASSIRFIVSGSSSVPTQLMSIALSIVVICSANAIDRCVRGLPALFSSIT